MNGQQAGEGRKGADVCWCAAGGAAAPIEEDQWRDAYELGRHLVPSFISEDLARKIVRAGKSINFLREECGDVAWVQKAAQAHSFPFEQQVCMHDSTPLLAKCFQCSATAVVV